MIIKAGLAVLLLAIGAVNAAATEAGWSVWTAKPSISKPSASTPGAPLPFVRHYITDELPLDQKRNAFLLGYAGKMRAKGTECLERGEAGFTQADLDELYQLMTISWESLPDDIRRVQAEGIMHWKHNGGGGLVEASCLDARKWLSEDIPSFSSTRRDAPTP